MLRSSCAAGSSISMHWVLHLLLCNTVFPYRLTEFIYRIHSVRDFLICRFIYYRPVFLKTVYFWKKCWNSVIMYKIVKEVNLKTTKSSECIGNSTLTLIPLFLNRPLHLPVGSLHTQHQIRSEPDCAISPIKVYLILSLFLTWRE